MSTSQVNEIKNLYWISRISYSEFCFDAFSKLKEFIYLLIPEYYTKQ